MEFTAAQLAGLLEGTIEGNPDILLNDLAQIEKGKQGSVCFLSDVKYAEFLYSTSASAVLVSNDFIAEKQLPETLTLIRVKEFSDLEDRYLGNEELLKELDKKCSGSDDLYIKMGGSKVWPSGDDYNSINLFK